MTANSSNYIAKNIAGNSVSIDTNTDGEIQVSEALLIAEIQLVNPQTNQFMSAITSMDGIQGFTNLKKLTLSFLNNLSSISLNGHTNIMEVNIADCDILSNVNFQGCTSLKTLIMTRNYALTSLSVTNLTNLEFLQVPQNGLASINVSGCSALKNFYVWDNWLTSLDLSNLVNLLSVDVYNNNLSSLTLLNNNSLTLLNASGNALQSIATNQSPLLYKLVIDNNNFSNLAFSGFPGLAILNCSNNQFTSIDVSSINNLVTFSCSNNPNLAYLFVKNGKNNFTQTQSQFSNTPNLVYICADDNEISDINTRLTNYGQTNVVVNSYCSFTPGGTFYTIQGNTKYDVNANGCDVNDPMKAFQKFTITNGSVTGNVIANSTGNYTIPVQAGSHTVTPILENPTYFTISPTSFTANFPAQASPLTQNFCITSNGNFNDLEVFVIPVTAAVPGFNAKYKLVFKNKGTTTQSGTLTMSFDDNLINFNTSTVSPNTQSTGNLSWNFTNLTPFETREIILTFTLNTPTATPPLNSGNILSYNVIISGATDETPSDNSFALNQTVVNSFDPNDKTCLEGTAISTAKVGDYVHYLIRFENNGTANAQNIVVKDVIDTNKFDLNSLIALNGSHSFVTRITAPNTVEFIFENIQLPFNDATNDGFVTFKIKTKSTLVLGDTFSNSAKIYFDYNAPITTNTYTTAVQNILATNEVENSRDFMAFPNPVENFVYFKTKENLLKAEVFDVSGRIILSVGVSNNSADLSSLSKGVYLIKVFTKDKSYLKKLVKK